MAAQPYPTEHTNSLPAVPQGDAWLSPLTLAGKVALAPWPAAVDISSSTLWPQERPEQPGAFGGEGLQLFSLWFTEHLLIVSIQGIKGFHLILD